MEGLADKIGEGFNEKIKRHSRRAGQGFGRSFGTELTSSLPGVGRFTSAMAGYEGAAAKTGALAGRALGLAFTTAAAGLVGAAGVALFKGFDRYKSLDATAHRLGAMGKSAQEVNEIMASINDVVEGTPIALDAAAASATKFLQSGVRQGRPMELALGAIADAAGASGARFEDLSLIFNQVLNKGKLQAEEMMQFAERNLPIQAALQREFGLTGAELEKMSKEGTLSFGMLVQAVDGQFGGMAKKLGDTVDGALSNIQAAVGRTGANFISAIFGDPLSTTEGPGAFAESLNNVKNRIEDINQWVIAHQDDIKRYFDQAVDAVGDLANAIKTIADKLNELHIGIDDVAKAFAAWKLIKFGAVITNLGNVGTEVSKIGMIKPAAGSVLALLAGLEAVDWRDRLNTNDPRNIQNRAERGDWGSVLLGDLWPFLRGPQPPPAPGPGAPGVPFDPSVILGGPAPGQAGTNPLDVFAPVAPPPGAPSAPQDNGPIADLFPPAAGADGSSGSKGPTLPVVPYSGDPMSLLQGFQVTSSLYSAAEGVLKARHDRAQAESDLNALMASNEATAEEIQKARNKLAQADGDIFQAELRLNEAKQSATEKYAKNLEGLTADLGELGAGLDKDFGISKGLAGIAENITKFVANLAAAPLLGQLGAISAVNPTQGGHGLMGVLGAQGVFGPQYMNNQYADQVASSSAMGPAMWQPSVMTGGGHPYGLPKGTDIRQGAAGFPPWVYAVANAFGLDASTYSGHQERGGLNRGIDWWPKGKSDMSGLSYTPDELARLDAFAQWLDSSGLAEQVIWQNPRTGNQVGFPDNVDYSGDYPDHLGHVHTRHSRSLPLPGGFGQRGFTTASGPVPVTVQQWNADWNAIAQGESGGNWHINTGNGFSGGLQFTPQSWAAAGGTQFAPSAHMATPFQQALTAEQLLKMQGPGAWPNTFVPGSSGPSPMAGGTMPGMGMPQAAPFGSPASGAGFGPPPGPTQIGGGPGLSGSGSGGVGMTSGGVMDLAMQAGGLALDAMAPGAGQLAQTGMKLINRTIEYGSQVAGIAAQGLMDTVLPFGGSELASNNWLTRIVGGLAGAAPALPNLAGKAAGQLSKEQVAQQQQQGQPQQGQQPIQVHYEAHNQTEDRNGADLTWHMEHANSGPGM